jgi:hypothetical protein
MACLAITGAMKLTPTAAMEVLLNLTPLDLLIMVEARDPILEMLSDHTIPVYYHYRLFKVIIDLDYWKNKNPVFPEDALIWFTYGSRTDSETGSGIFGLRPKGSFSSLWVNSPQFFKLKFMPSYNVHVKI